ncbi:MAG TPA: porin [Thermoanaerobaculia bacterium]|nr:porin [Thermoanaerobaculia bacterium]
MKRVILFLMTCVAASMHAEEPISFSGFIDLAAVYNQNRPASHENFVPGTGTSGKRANELMLNLAQVQWSRTATPEQPIGFTLSLVAGDGTDVVHAGEPNGPGEFRHVYQASVAYRLRNGVLLEAGIYPSHIGLEGFYSRDNWNYTRSWLGEFSPYYQSGVKASYSLNGRWSAQVHVLNGWQLIHDNNDGKSIGTQLAYANGPLTASLNTFLGPELANDDHSLRKFVDLVVLYRVAPGLQLGGSLDVGAQERPDASDARWLGAGAFARYAFTDRHAVAVRAEQFRDRDAGITGAGQTLREATVTYELRPREHLILKLETRYDRSSARVFADDERTELLAIAGAVVTF